MKILMFILVIILLVTGTALSGAVSLRCHSDIARLGDQEAWMILTDTLPANMPSAEACERGRLMAGFTAVLSLILLVVRYLRRLPEQVKAGLAGILVFSTLASLVFVPFYDTGVQDMSPGHLMRIVAFCNLTGSGIILRQHLHHR